MTIDIDAIRKREQAATPGPWKAVDFNHDTAPRTAYGVWGESDDDLCIFEDVDTLLADAEFIAHARQDIPALLAEIDRLTAELETKTAVAKSNARHAAVLTEVIERIDQVVQQYDNGNGAFVPLYSLRVALNGATKAGAEVTR